MLLDIFHAGGSFERPYGYGKAVPVRPENEHESKEAWGPLAGTCDFVYIVRAKNLLSRLGLLERCIMGGTQNSRSLMLSILLHSPPSGQIPAMTSSSW